MEAVSSVAEVDKKTEYSIPRKHTGVAYSSFLAQLVEKRHAKRYLEIGVSEGALLSLIKVPTAVGVDPAFKLKHNVIDGKNRLSLYQGTSDEFFREGEPKQLLGGSPDFVFLDGLHVFEYLLRDFYNTEAIATKETLVAMHDCLPLNYEMAIRDSSVSIKLGMTTSFPRWWAGDVWKIIPILQEYRPDLRIVAVDAPPTGLVLITNLDPQSTILKDKYFEIVDKYAAIEGNLSDIDQIYKTIKITKTSDILHKFNESLYFRA
jgi:hypothetical protein